MNQMEKTQKIWHQTEFSNILNAYGSEQVGNTEGERIVSEKGGMGRKLMTQVKDNFEFKREMSTKQLETRIWGSGGEEEGLNSDCYSLLVFAMNGQNFSRKAHRMKSKQMNKGPTTEQKPNLLPSTTQEKQLWLGCNEKKKYLSHMMAVHSHRSYMTWATSSCKLSLKWELPRRISEAAMV